MLSSALIDAENTSTPTEEEDFSVYIAEGSGINRGEEWCCVVYNAVEKEIRWREEREAMGGTKKRVEEEGFLNTYFFLKKWQIFLKF